ncbi:hypothetical protein BOX15_Mlig014843g1 [Macrostomum lignano]|uniref:Mab-21-like HhH/H2TH-like domain-containing protein n=1 Tax=Macrostomum lignano TaxID=282301 RepID=A0A267F1U2_9PLAT|nr:hypothetical protein BOX15_Mlig014843g1 [Macrostomum lignano]
MAAQNDHCAAAERLLVAQADVNLPQQNGGTPLLIATQQGHGGMVRRLIQAKADVNCGNVNGTTPLYIASQYGNAGLIQRLLDAGAAPDQPETDGTAPLWVAAQNGHFEAVERLVQAGCELDPRRLETQSTPLFIAAENNNLDIVELLITAGANTELADYHNQTPLYTAAWSGYLSVVERLIEAGAAVDVARSDDGTTALFRAAIRDHAALVKRLAAAGANVNHPARNGHTALVAVSLKGDAKMAALLLQLGADATVACGNENPPLTPLRAAVEFNRVAVVRVLLDDAFAKGRRFNNCDEAFRRDALDCTRLSRRRGLREIASQLGAFWNTRPVTPGQQQSQILTVESSNITQSRAAELRGPQSLHEAFNAAGFTSDRAAFQCAMSDVLEEVIRGHRNTREVNLVGSYSEGWGNSLVSLNGRTDPDSDLDITEFSHRRLFHIRGRCRCTEPQVEDVLDYDRGHVLYEGASSNPSLPDRGSDLRPAMDLVPAFACCSYPDIAVLHQQDTYLPKLLLAELRAELSRPRSCHLIRASAPGFEAKQMRVSTTFFEKRFMRSLTAVQGQLFLTLKFLIKRVIGKELNVHGLKSYHAKTLTFRMVTSMEPRLWQPENLRELVCTALEDLRHCLTTAPPGECMPHYFMQDAPLYLRRGSSAKAEVIAALDKVKSNLAMYLSSLASQLQPLTDAQASFRLHPFTLLPIYLVLPWPDEGELQYHHLYAVVRKLVLDLGAPKTPRTQAELQEMYRLAQRLPYCALTARTCLLALALLRMSRPSEAAQQLRLSLGFERRHQRPLLRSLPVGLAAGQDDGGRGNIRRLLETTDSAWRFCFYYESLPGPSFHYLLPSPSAYASFPCIMASYENFFYVNFEALARLLMCQLAPDLLTTAETDSWFRELQTGDPDWLEVAVLAQHSRRPEQLRWALSWLSSARPESLEMLRDIREKIDRLRAPE